MSITCVTLLLQFSDVRNIFDVNQQCENDGHTKYCSFDISTLYLSVNCSENSLNCYNLSHVDGISRSCGWDKEILHAILPMEQLVLSHKRARIMCFAQGHSAVTPVRLESTAPGSLPLSH